MQKSQRLKPLLDQVPAGFVVDGSWLKAQGITRGSVQDYVRRGWLEPLTRGVYRRPFSPDAQDNIRTGWLVPILSIQHLLGYDIHVGGPTALDEHGHVHYLRASEHERIFVYGDTPTWLNRLPGNAVFIQRSRKLFQGELLGVQKPDGGSSLAASRPWQLILSSPERAILEALDELPKNESFHNIDMIFEGLVNLRPKLLMQCLESCKSIKAKRLFFVFAEKHGHAWLKHIDKTKIEFGSGPRALIKDGKFHPKYHISVPEEFIPITSSEGVVNV